MAGALKCVFEQMGISIDDEKIAKNLPSRAYLADLENCLAADCFIKVIYEAIKDKATKFALITDHGHRKGQDHFVKLLVWAGYDENGKPTTKVHCLDIDIGGHSTAEAAAAVKISVEPILSVLKKNSDKTDEVEIIDLTGDTGSGAAVQHLGPALVSNEACPS